MLITVSRDATRDLCLCYMTPTLGDFALEEISMSDLGWYHPMADCHKKKVYLLNAEAGSTLQ